MIRRFVSWNVNGLRAALGKGFLDFCRAENADAICVQETKMQLGQAAVDLPGYEQFWNSADRKGYSGTAAFTRLRPSGLRYDIEAAGHDTEGRAITLEFDAFYLVTEYTPNAQDGLARIGYRMEWEDAMRAYLVRLDAQKPVILCGDLNVAHNEIDLKNPKSNRGNAGFSDEERGKFDERLAAGFTDAFRFLYPDRRDAYTWWSFRAGARARNAGWRIDYFLVSNRIAERVEDMVLLNDVHGSDHCPVRLLIDL
ncbi:MAG: exodeoxyribonuclease III [Clostridiales Family XIII bacterium]|jgi:exodeoxyribonuclease-3|nr:exodeoxyribonuclease III [Clostridiales Family XIII bacterium]